MAWRIDEQVVRGEIDNRSKGRVTGRIWMTGREEPVELEFTGNPWADLAGHTLRFRNPQPKPGLLDSFNPRQKGVVGDITASRKVKIPDCSEEEFIKCYEERRPFPWHWANSLYLEWFSLTNGRVVIESGSFELEIDDEPAWTMDAEEEEAQRIRNAEALTDFMNRLGAMVAEADEDHDDDAPQSEAEAKADAETEWMNRLLDRAMDFSVKLRADIADWLPEDATSEHPLREIAWGVQLASVKIGGALGHDDDEPWPPEALFAGDTLVRLKKSRDSLRDALRAMDSADEENLAPAPWRIATRREIAEILGEVQKLIQELRDVLKDSEEET